MRDRYLFVKVRCFACERDTEHLVPEKERNWYGHAKLYFITCVECGSQRTYTQLCPSPEPDLFNGGVE